MKKWIIAVVVVVLLAGGTTWFFYNKKESKAATGVITRTATVQQGTLTSNVSGSGDLVPAVDTDIKATAANTINDVLVKASQKVEKGQDLITFTDGSTPITAPATGIITQVNVYAGDRVNAGQAVVHLTNYSDLNTVIQVDELDIPQVKTKQPVNITVNAFPDKTYQGTVKSIAPQGTDTNGVSSFDVTVHLTSSTGLKPGMTTTANITTNKKANALYIPVESVHKINNQYYVLVPTSKTGATQSSQSGQATSTKQGSGSGRSGQWSGNRSGSGQGGQWSGSHKGSGSGQTGQWAGNRQGGQGTTSGQSINAGQTFNTAQASQFPAKRIMVKTGIHNDSDIQIVSGLSAGMTVELPPIVMSSSSSQTQSQGAQIRGMFGGGGGYGGFRGGGGAGGSFSGGGKTNG